MIYFGDNCLSGSCLIYFGCFTPSFQGLYLTSSTNYWWSY